MMFTVCFTAHNRQGACGAFHEGVDMWEVNMNGKEVVVYNPLCLDRTLDRVETALAVKQHLDYYKDATFTMHKSHKKPLQARFDDALALAKRGVLLEFTKKHRIQLMW